MPAERWHLSPDPLLVVGGADADEGSRLGRVMAGVLTLDGRVLVADQMSAVIREYGPDGGHRSDWGPGGVNAGTFDMLWTLFPFRGDSVLAGEAFSNRLSVFTTDGYFGRTIDPNLDTPRAGEGRRPVEDCCRLWGALPSGEFIFSFPEMAPVAGGGSASSSLDVARVSEDGSRAEPLRTLVDREFQPSAGASGTPVPVALGSAAAVVPSGQGFVATDGRGLRAHLVRRRRPPDSDRAIGPSSVGPRW